MTRENKYSVSILSCKREIDIAWFKTYEEAVKFASTCNGRINTLSRAVL